MLQIKLFILNNLIETRKEKDTNKNGLMVIVTSLRERPFNLKGGGGGGGYVFFLKKYSDSQCLLKKIF